MKINRSHNAPPANSGRPSWRAYQAQLNRRGRRRRPDLGLLVKGAGFLALVLAALWLLGRPDTQAPPAETGPRAAVDTRTPVLLSKSDVQDLLADRPAADLLGDRLFVRWGDHKLTVDSSIDEALQRYLSQHLYERTSRYIAIVVMEAASGRILALVGYDNRDPNGDPCLNGQFPAASIFKIVTAGAAMEHCKLSGGSTLTYNGAKHTLYKSQLKAIENRYTHRTTLADAFAQSINPIFGKLGSHCLGQQVITQYAEAFGFNRPIPFELAVPASQAIVTGESYQWAEVASGFNRQTLISPLHGALIAAVAPNKGFLVEPTIVDGITSPQGQTLYRPGRKQDCRAVTPQTAKEMERLMQETVSRGTARKIFRSRAKDDVLSRLVIGGKTGSIDNAGHDARFDWFVGFARHPETEDAIAVSVVVAHEKYIGRRAGEYARMAMKEYFRHRVAAAGKSS